MACRSFLRRRAGRYTLSDLLSFFVLSFWDSDVMCGTSAAILGHEERLRMTEQKDRRTLEAASCCAALGWGLHGREETLGV